MMSAATPGLSVSTPGLSALAPGMRVCALAAVRQTGITGCGDSVALTSPFTVYVRVGIKIQTAVFRPTISKTTLHFRGITWVGGPLHLKIGRI
jgi:hypothetical protein